MTHIGVLAALEEAGIPIDMMAGTSSGAIVAVGACAGKTAAQIAAFARRFSWLRLLRPVWPRRGLASFAGLRMMLERELGPIDLCDLALPCVVAVTDLFSGQPVYLQSGPLAQAVQASCSVPGFVEPLRWGDWLLAEGGLTDMLPVGPLRRLGADYVIGVDIFAFKLRRFLGPLGYLFGGLEIALQRAGGGTDDADCLIRPDLSGWTYMRFGRADAMIALGYEAARVQIPNIRRDLGLDTPSQAPIDLGAQRDLQPALQPAVHPIP
jgi:NTE family protein